MHKAVDAAAAHHQQMAAWRLQKIVSMLMAWLTRQQGWPSDQFELHAWPDLRFADCLNACCSLAPFKSTSLQDHHDSLQT